jgi:hypothetical protein
MNQPGPHELDEDTATCVVDNDLDILTDCGYPNACMHWVTGELTRGSRCSNFRHQTSFNPQVCLC